MILLDGFMQLYRCNYKLSDLVTRDGRYTGMEYGFLKGLEAFRRFWNDEIIICWEGRKNFRYQIDQDYKISRRKKKEKEVHQWLTPERIENFKKLLSMVAENAWDDELEADDVMASLAIKYAKKEDVIIYSSDKDMFQILQDKPFKIHQCRDYQHRKKLWTPNRLKLEWHGLEPKHIPEFLAYAGDKSDDIPGAVRVRQPRIAGAILEGLSPENIGDYLLFSSKEVFSIEEHVSSGRFAKNLELVTLKIKEDIPIHQRNWQPTKIGDWLRNMEFRTLKLCQQVGIEEVVEEDEEF